LDPTGNNAHSLKGQRALVCGSSQGIGLASAVALAERGASVSLVARDERALEAVRERLPRDQGQAHAVVVADFDDPEALGSRVRAHLAEVGPCSILVNNTGGPPGGPITDATASDFQRAMTRHLIANQTLLQAVLPGMKELGYGRVINITSTSVVAPIPGLGVSNTVRAAVANWARTLAYELGPFGITVNNVLPGYTDTARLRSLVAKRAEREGLEASDVEQRWRQSVPLRRFATPQEQGEVVAFLASPAAAYVTGVNLPVDGGRTAAQ